MKIQTFSFLAGSKPASTPILVSSSRSCLRPRRNRLLFVRRDLAYASRLCELHNQTMTLTTIREA
jgi:hypothetical protein